jgi:protein TonB
MALPTKLGFRKVAGLLGIGVLGTAVVITGLVIMNSVVQGPDEQERDDSVSFDVEPPQPDPPPDQPEPQQREPRPRNRPSLAPPPDLGSSLSGIQVSLPEFQASGVESISDSLLGQLEDVALTEDTVDEPPVKRNAPTPPYPERAKQREIQGQVRVSLLVGAQGNVKRLKILESSPPGVFDEVVRNTVSNWTFRPARYNGEPVETWVTVPIPFRLN